MNPSERRRDPRVVHSFMVRYRAANMEDSHWMLSPLKDFSTRGARFVSEPGLQNGDAVELQLMLPMRKEPLVLVARLAWTKPFGDGSLVEQGVEFDAKDTPIQALLEDAVAHFLTQRKPGE